ncbi:MAG: hypothetical protein EBY80_12375 [Actinobacteria bacterium]|nr:hypothetical protein [Actinomycetota bacterium]
MFVPHPDGKVALPMESNTVNFAHAARTLAHEARVRGLLVPGFRCPPRILGVDRSLRRWDGGATVAVRVKGRPWVAVVADMIEGVVVLNRLEAADATRARSALWLTLEQAPHDAHVA